MLRAVRDAFVGEGTLSERQGAVLVATSGVVFSFTAIAYAAVDSATDMQFLAYRGISTAVAMLLLIAARRPFRPVSFAGVGWRTWLAGCTLAGTSMLYILALARTSTATTLFLLAAAPVVAAVLGWVLLREPVARSTVVAIAVSAVGVTITVGAGLDLGSATGLLFAGLIPFTIGLYSVLMRTAPGVDPVIPALIAGGVLGVGASVAALAGPGLGVSARDIVLASVSGGFALGVGLPMFNLGHRSVPAARVPLLLMTEVVLAPIWVWIWPGEVPTVSTLVGGGVIIAAVVVLLLGTERARPVLPTAPDATRSAPDAIQSVATAPPTAASPAPASSAGGRSPGTEPVATGRSASVDHPDHDPT